MSVILKKGDSVDLSKESNGTVKAACVGLDWGADPVAYTTDDLDAGRRPSSAKKILCVSLTGRLLKVICGYPRATLSRR